MQSFVIFKYFQNLPCIFQKKLKLHILRYLGVKLADLEMFLFMITYKVMLRR